MIPLFIKALNAAQAKKSTPTVKAQQPVKAKKDAPDLQHFSALLALLAEHEPGGDFGPHNVDTDHHVAFAAGAYTGAGKVTATGRDGLVVEDEKRREHRVHWREVTGHFAPGKSDNAKPKTPRKTTQRHGT